MPSLLSRWLSNAEVVALKRQFPSTASVLMIASTIFGPKIYPRAHIALIIMVLTYNVQRCVSHLVQLTLGVYKSQRVLWQCMPRKQYQYKHVIVLPNYTEPLSLLKESIARYAVHENARQSYIIVLAMEGAEDGSFEKGQYLADFFGKYFFRVFVTIHPKDLPNECRGKGSNVSWAVQRLHDSLGALRLDINDILITVTDADATLPELYFDELDRKQAGFDSCGIGKSRLFAPPILFAKNSSSVPMLVRVSDSAWSVAVMQNLSSVTGIHFPCSTYSLPMIMARDVGWWDTDAAAIGEDMHMFLKCFYASNGKYRCATIWVAVNLTNVFVDGYLASMYAKFTQAKRHFAGSSDTYYAWKNTFEVGHSFKDLFSGSEFRSKVICFASTFEAHMSPTLWIVWFYHLPIALLIIGYESYPSLFNKAIAIQSVTLFVLLLISITYEFYYSMLLKCGLYDPPTSAQLLRAQTASEKTKDFAHGQDSDRSRDSSVAKGEEEVSSLLDIKFCKPCVHRWYQFFENTLIVVGGLLFIILPAAANAENTLRILFRKHRKELVYIVAEKKTVHND